MSEAIINIAIRAARAAGNLIIRAADRPDKITIIEKAPGDYVTDTDQQAEREIINIIKRAYPRHGILGEESGETSGELSGKDFVWVIDPIDGTRNFIHGFPHFCVSIAVMCKGKVEHGVIYDPVRQELFCATRGKGAKLNDRRIRVSKRTQLEECLVGTGFPYRHSKAHQKAYLEALQTIIPHCGDVRRAGSAALDLAYVAAGRLDGFWEVGLKLWDIAAGTLLIKEAGGLVSDFTGSEEFLNNGNVIAGNPKTLKPMLKLLQPHLATL